MLNEKMKPSTFYNFADSWQQLKKNLVLQQTFDEATMWFVLVLLCDDSDLHIRVFK